MRIGKNIALEFNEFSKNYTRDMIACVPHYLELISSFERHLPNQFRARTILDLGSGNGNVTARLLPLFPEATYTLVDASAEMIDRCRELFRDYDMRYANQYFKDFTFEKEKYDLITAGFSLHHCDEAEKQSLFQKIYSALRPGGIFAYSDMMISRSNPDHLAIIDEWKTFVHHSFPDGEKWAWLMEHYEAFDKPTDYDLQIRWMRDAGFSDIQMPFKEGYWIYMQAVK